MKRDEEVQRGLVLLQQAAVQAPHIPDIRYHLAVAYSKAGRQQEALEVLRNLLSNAQIFADIDAAKQLLSQLQGQ